MSCAASWLSVNFIKAAREAAALVNSATLQTELNKQLASIALPDDDLIKKIDKELSRAKGADVKPKAPIPLV